MWFGDNWIAVLKNDIGFIPHTTYQDKFQCIIKNKQKFEGTPPKKIQAQQNNTREESQYY